MQKPKHLENISTIVLKCLNASTAQIYCAMDGNKMPMWMWMCISAHVCVMFICANRSGITSNSVAHKSIGWIKWSISCVPNLCFIFPSLSRVYFWHEILVFGRKFTLPFSINVFPFSFTGHVNVHSCEILVYFFCITQRKPKPNPNKNHAIKIVARKSSDFEWYVFIPAPLRIIPVHGKWPIERYLCMSSPLSTAQHGTEHGNHACV